MNGSRFSSYLLGVCLLSAAIGAVCLPSFAFASNNRGGLSAPHSSRAFVKNSSFKAIEARLKKAQEKLENAERTLQENASKTLESMADDLAKQPALKEADTPENKKDKPRLPVTKHTAPVPYIGDMKTISARYEDTLVQLMRDYDIGYVEIRAANPGVDIWIPGKGTQITLPLRHLLPDVPRTGIVINLAEMRLYSFVEDPNNPVTHPIGIGREGLSTPTGKARIIRKKDGPTWRPTARMREENPDLPVEVPAGEDNPLGTHALYLNWPSYLIHGTHRPWGIGRRVSSGCIRMYPEDIITLFNHVPVGTPVNVIRQPVKTAWIDNVLYLEAHADSVLADNIESKGHSDEYSVPDNLFIALKKQLGVHYKKADWPEIRTILKERRGYPIAILDLRVSKADAIAEESVVQIPALATAQMSEVSEVSEASNHTPSKEQIVAPQEKATKDINDVQLEDPKPQRKRRRFN